MRKYMYIIFSLIILACARDVSKVKSEAAEHDAAESDYEFMIEVNDENAENIVIEEMEVTKKTPLKTDEDNWSSSSLEDLSSQKLKEYFDLIQLKQQHPEFKNDIITQLQKFSSDTTIGQNYSKDFKIDNIRQIGSPVVISDSIKKLKLGFDVIKNQSKIKDSLFVIITQKQIIINESPINTIDFKFETIFSKN